MNYIAMKFAVSYQFLSIKFYVETYLFIYSLADLSLNWSVRPSRKVPGTINRSRTNNIRDSGRVSRKVHRAVTVNKNFPVYQWIIEFYLWSVVKYEKRSGREANGEDERTGSTAWPFVKPGQRRLIYVSRCLKFYSTEATRKRQN